MVAQRTRDYELVIIISPEANEEEINATIERVTLYITERGGSIIEQVKWGLRRLAYPIRRFHEGTYALMRFSADSDDIIGLDQSLKASEDILRHLTTRLDKSVKINLETATESVDSDDTTDESKGVDAQIKSEETPTITDSAQSVASNESPEEEQTEDPSTKSEETPT